MGKICVGGWDEHYGIFYSESGRIGIPAFEFNGKFFVRSRRKDAIKWLEQFVMEQAGYDADSYESKAILFEA